MLGLPGVPQLPLGCREGDLQSPQKSSTHFSFAWPLVLCATLRPVPDLWSRDWGPPQPPNTDTETCLAWVTPLYPMLLLLLCITEAGQESESPQTDQGLRFPNPCREKGWGRKPGCPTALSLGWACPGQQSLPGGPQEFQTEKE